MRHRHGQPDASRGHRGCTLIELMVVVAIITALIAILLPSMSRARKTAQTAVCASNLRQNNFGFQTYFIENKYASYPYPGNGNSSFPHFWMGKIDPYVQSVDDIRLCPGASNDNGSVWGSAVDSWNGLYHPAGYWIHRNEDMDHDGQSDYWYGSYAMNAWMYNGQYANESYDRNYSNPGANVPIASAPTFIDCAWVDLWPRTGDVAAASLLDPVNGGNWGAGMVRSTLDRHLMGVNAAFMDGHVDYLKLNRLWWLKWSKLFQPGVGVPAI